MTWQATSTSVTGKSHLLKNIPCQDAVHQHIAENEDDVNVVVLSDGAGSCKYSDLGAQQVTRFMVNYLGEQFHQICNEMDGAKAKVKIVEDLQSFVNQFASDMDVPYKELSCTLLFIAICKNNYLAGQIGDGIIGIQKEDVVEPIFLPENGEYINSTYFVTGNQAAHHLQLLKGKLTNEEGFILMSDGPAESLYERNTKRISPAAIQMLEWLNDNPLDIVHKALEDNIRGFILPRTQDDCSIGLMKRVKNSENEGIERISMFQLIKNLFAHLFTRQSRSKSRVRI